VKPLSPVAVSCTACPAAPMVRLRDWGLTASEKSACAGGGAVTVMGREAECVNVPEVPVNVAVEDPAAVPEGAVSVSVEAVPGVSVSEDGCAVTPAGSPLIATWTLEENPFCAVASTDTMAAVPFAVKVTEAGITLSEKSAGAAPVTESEACVLAVFPPTLAVNVMVAVVVGVDEEAVIVSGKATPGVTDNVAGEMVTPLGNPDTETVAALPPPAPPSRREACWPAAPAVTWMLDGERVSVGCDPLSLLLELLPPLQEARPLMMRALAASERTTLENECERRVEQSMAAPGSTQLGG
jgi:hypothetical protein